MASKLFSSYRLVPLYFCAARSGLSWPTANYRNDRREQRFQPSSECDACLIQSSQHLAFSNQMSTVAVIPFLTPVRRLFLDKEQMVRYRERTGRHVGATVGTPIISGGQLPASQTTLCTQRQQSPARQRFFRMIHTPLPSLHIFWIAY